MKDKAIQIKAYRQPWVRDRIAIRLAMLSTDSEGNARVSIADQLTLRLLTDDEMCIEQPPLLEISPEEAQQFMDELWRVGIRPTEGAGSVGQMEATVKHLEDMRRLVFEGVEGVSLSK